MPVTRYKYTITLFLFALCATAGRAQEVTGTVRAEVGRAPVTGAIVILVAPSGARLTATLTNDAGRFRLRTASSGVFTLRVDVIGYRSVIGPPFPIDSGATVTRDVLFPFVRTQLPRVAVTATSGCARLSGDAGDAPALWAEARKTLEAASLAIEERRFSVALRRYERSITLPDSVLGPSRTWTQTGVTRNPFESLSPEAMARDGFSAVRDTTRFYYAPDARVLLSDEFVAAHCFGTRRGGAAGAIGLTFRPQRTIPRRVDISGVLWLDSATAELRTLEYRYLPMVGRQDVGGGFVAFGRYPSGVWGVQRWAIRLPVLQVYESRRRPDGALGRFVDTLVLAVREVGGEVMSAGGSSVTLTPASDSRLIGAVFDSSQGAALSGAVVTIEGLGLTARTDSAGQFAFSVADEGDVRVRVWHPRLDSLGVAAPTSTLRLRRRAEVTAQFSIPGVGAVARRRCVGTTPDTPRVIMGVVRSASDSTQPSVEVVLLEWRGTRADGTDSLVRHVETSNEVGRYAFCDVRPGAQGWLLAHTGSNWSDPRHVGGENIRPVEIVPLRLPLGPDPAVDESVSLSSAAAGAPALLLGRAVGAGPTSRIGGWALLAEKASGTVQVLLDDVLRTTVAPDGSFALDSVGVGERRLTFRAPTLAVRHLSVNVQAGQSHLLLVTLRVAPIVIVQQQPRAPDERLVEFRRRRNTGEGVFLDRLDIGRRNPRTLTDLLRSVPGVRVQAAASGGYRYVSSHFRRLGQEASSGDGGTCDMMMYVDGQPFPTDGDVDSRIRVTEIAAIEVYVTAGSVPRRFAGLNAACGVIVIWRG